MTMARNIWCGEGNRDLGTLRRLYSQPIIVKGKFNTKNIVRISEMY